MLMSCYRGTELPGGERLAVALSLLRTAPGAGGGSGCEEGPCGLRGRGLKHGKGVMGEGMSCTCLGAEVEGESEGGRVSWLKGAGLGDLGRLKVWVETLR